MSLIFAAVIPNHPKLADDFTAGVSPENRLPQTVAALKDLEGELYFMKPDTIVLLTAHGAQVPGVMNINIATKPHGEQGECVLTDVEFAAHLKEQIDTKRRTFPVALIADSTITPEISGPLRCLLHHLKETKVVVISTACVSQQDHVQFGDFLRRESLETNKRIAIIVSGHLSEERDSKQSAQQSLDQLCLSFLRQQQPEKILQINKELCDASASDLLEPLSALIGAIQPVNTNTEILSYEQLHGQGQLVANFILR